MRLRSLLYVPAHIEKFVAKASERGTDAVILDLEDSVPTHLKTQARTALEDAVPIARGAGTKVFVRVNSGATMVQDSQAAISAGADGLVVPKVQSTTDLQMLSGLCSRLIAVIETATGLLNAREIAAHPDVIGVLLGAEDFATDVGGQPDSDVVRVPKLMVHYAAKAAGKLSLGLLRSAVQFSDVVGLTEAAQEAARHGFDGATCVHPTIVPVLNAAFSPTQEQVVHAQRVLQANTEAQRQGKGAFMFEGEFIDAPILARYQRLLQRAGVAFDV